MPTAIEFENISKQYRLGLVSTNTLSHDLKRWYAMNIQGKEDPYLKIGEVNDRAHRGESDYVWALKDINFKVEQGDVLGIIGKNGAGKSTLLKILSKVTTPSTGTIKARGRIASLLEVGTGFHPEMTGRENIYMNGAIMGMTKAEISRKFDEIVDFSGVERYIDTPAKRYSSGMTVRLGFAIAAHLEPEILVVDEVLAVGDAEFQKKAIGKMQDVSKGEGRTVLFVSHNMASIKSLCPKSLLLSNGSVDSYGDTEKIIDKYINMNQITVSTWQRLVPKNSHANFIHASIVDDNNNQIQVVSNNKDCFVRLLIDVESTNFDGTFAFEIMNQMEQSIFTSHDFDLMANISKKGKYEVKIPVPKLLRAGNYYLNLGSNIRGFTTLEYFPAVLGFEYIDELYGGQTQSRPGSVFVPLQWDISKIQ